MARANRKEPTAPVAAEPAELRHIKDLIADPENRRAHNPRNIGMLVDALHHVGAARSIVIDEDNIVRAGNGVVEAAAEAGIHKVRVVEADGDEIIAVRRRGWSDEQKRAAAIYDNRTGELSEWNFDQLAADHDAGLDLQPFWTDAEAAKLLGPAPPDAFKEVGASIETSFRCPSCHYEWSGQPKPATKPDAAPDDEAA